MAEISQTQRQKKRNATALNSNFAPAVKQATSQRAAALPHSEPRCSYILFQFRNQTPMVTVRGAYCVIVGSIFDANQQNKTRLENHFYHRDIITIAKLKTWAPCGSKLATLVFVSQTHYKRISPHILPPYRFPTPLENPTYIQHTSNIHPTYI